MIALAILAVGLVALSGVSGSAMAMHAYSKRASEATLLLRSKMLDLEEKLQKDGFSDFDDEKTGNFEDDGAPGYTWRAEILKPDIQISADQLLSMLGAGGGGAGGGSGSAQASGSGAGPLNAAAGMLSGAPGGGGGALAAAGPFAGMISGQAKTFIETLKKSVREVRLTVSWRDGSTERSISASQQLVILPEQFGKNDQDLARQQQQQQLLNGAGMINPPGSVAAPPPGGPVPVKR